MIIREYTPADLGHVLEMYQQQGLDYRFPDLDDPIFFDMRILENGSGIPEMAYAARLTAEAYFFLRPTIGTPAERWDKLKALQRAGEDALAAKGIQDVHAFPPPEMEKRFGKRLTQLGWVKETWPCYSKVLVGG